MPIAKCKEKFPITIVTIYFQFLIYDTISKNNFATCRILAREYFTHLASLPLSLGDRAYRDKIPGFE